MELVFTRLTVLIILKDDADNEQQDRKDTKLFASDEITVVKLQCAYDIVLNTHCSKAGLSRLLYPLFSQVLWVLSKILHEIGQVLHFGAKRHFQDVWNKIDALQCFIFISWWGPSVA
jgi:hypothetical protein